MCGICASSTHEVLCAGTAFATILRLSAPHCDRSSEGQSTFASYVCKGGREGCVGFTGCCVRATMCRKQAHPLALSRAPYALTWSQAFRVLLKRQWKLTVRDSALVRGRIIQVRGPTDGSLLALSVKLPTPPVAASQGGQPRV